MTDEKRQDVYGEENYEATGPVNSEQMTDEEIQDEYEEENYEATGTVNSELKTKNAFGGLNSGGLDDTEVPQEDGKSVHE